MSKKFEIVSSLKNGIYRHYKGGLYEVKGVGLHSETKEQMVVYQNIEFGTLWIRPESMFYESVNVDGTLVPRFTFLRPTDSN